MITINGEDRLLRVIRAEIQKVMRSPKTIIASVNTVPPNLTLKYAGEIIPSEMIYCYDHLLIDYKRLYKLEGTISEITLDGTSTDTYSSSDMTLAGQGPHKHALTSSESSQHFEGNGTYKANGSFWFTDTLKVGDTVEVGIVGDKYIVRSKIVPMPGNSPGGA